MSNKLNNIFGLTTNGVYEGVDIGILASPS